MSVDFLDARNPGKARAGAAAASDRHSPSSAESEVFAAFIAREAIRFFKRTSVNRGSHPRGPQKSRTHLDQVSAAMLDNS